MGLVALFATDLTLFVSHPAHEMVLDQMLDVLSRSERDLLRQRSCSNEATAPPSRRLYTTTDGCNAAYNDETRRVFGRKFVCVIDTTAYPRCLESVGIG